MKAFFFGAPERQLFGAYHPPAEVDTPRAAAVVLAYPWMGEYNMSHWAFRKLAGMLAREGFPTLRFDYFGTGDSMGSPAQARYVDWVADIVTAAREVMDLSGLSSVSIVGMGLGAALAVEAAAAIAVRDLVLWKPVVWGSEYLRELEAMDDLQRLLRLYPPAPPLEKRSEVLGYPLSSEGRKDLAAVDALRQKPSLSGRAVLVASQDLALYQRLLASLRSAGNEAQLELVEEDSNQAVAGGDSALLASKSLLAITAALCGSEPS